MTRYGLVCLLFGALAWAQAASPKSTPAAQAPASTHAPVASGPDNPGPSREPDTTQVPPDAAVITIPGLCSHPPAGKTASSDCKTVISRAEFEKVVEAVQPNMPARARKQFASRYASALVMAKKAEEMGLDKGSSFEEHMKLARIQVLSQELNKAMQERASQVSDKDIEDYYHNTLAKYEEAELDRIFIPKNQQAPTPSGDKKVTEAEEQKRAQDAEQTMKSEADKLRARAVAGEDFNKLQAEAFQAAGIKASAPNTSMGKMRSTMLPTSQASVMELKTGEISPVISDQSGYFIYKLKSKATLPLDQVRNEIKGTLRGQRMQDELRAAQTSATPTLDDAYFGPEGPAREPMGPGAPPPGKTAAPPAPK